MDRPTQVFQDFLPQLIAIASTFARVIGSSVAFNPEDKSVLRWRKDAEVNKETIDTDLWHTLVTMLLKGLTHGSFKITIFLLAREAGDRRQPPGFSELKKGP